MTTIVVIEPNRTMLHLLIYLLERQGHQVVGLARVEEAAIFLQNNPCNLIVLDVGASASREEVAAAVAHLRQYAPHVPILLVTSDEGIVAAGAKAVDVDQVLGRPFDPQAFTHHVERLLSKGFPST